MRLRPFDILIAVAAIAAIAFSSISVYSRQGSDLRAVITTHSGEWVYPLGTDKTIEAAGPLGTTWVEIHGKKVHITDSPCANKTCIAAGDISSAGQWLACLPNRVFVRIEGAAADERAIDAGAF
jgi:hypothetical protein